MTVILTLGPVLFTDLEVPEHINPNTKQNLVVHKLIGGARKIDAMGVDYEPIKWSGKFRGSAAEVRAKLMDYLAAQGKPLTLTWSIYKYTVLIDFFEADYNSPMEIPYSVTCTVVRDETSPLLTALLGLDAAIGSDLNNILQVGAALNVPGINTAIAGVSSATTGVQSFAGASTAVISAAQTAITGALAVVGSNITAGNTVVAASGSVAGATAGSSPASIASSLISQASSFSALGSLYQLQSSLGRMFTNVGSGAS